MWVDVWVGRQEAKTSIAKQDGDRHLLAGEVSQAPLSNALRPFAMAIIDSYPVKLTGPKANRLADMAGVHLDLRWTTAACAQLSRRADKWPIGDMCIEALHDAAIIRYGRCFKGGRRTAFLIPGKWISNLPAELRQTHEDVLALRSKHIAHSANDWELNTPVVQLAIERNSGNATIASVSVSLQRVIAMSGGSISLLQELAQTLADQVEQEIKAEQARLLTYARTVPIDEFKRRLRDPAEFPGRRKIGKDRRRD